MKEPIPSTPKRRFLSGLFGGRRGDRISVASPTSIVSVELMEKTGSFFPEAHLDPVKMAGWQQEDMRSWALTRSCLNSVSTRRPRLWGVRLTGEGRP